MKNITKNIYVCITVVVLVVMGSCNEDEFLDRYPLDRPSPGSFFENETTARMALNAIYNPWQHGSASMLRRDMTILLDAMTDDSYWRTNRSSSIALEQWNITSTHKDVTAWWNEIYKSINAANFAIENIPLSSDPNFTEDKQKPFIAEAKFFRAYNYLFLTSFYGDIPLLTGPASNFEEFNTPVTPKSEIFKQIIEDFTYAKDFLPETQAYKGAPAKAAGAAFLAKAYLFTQEWSKAEVAAREAIQIAEASGYKMIDDYLSLWSDEGNDELLFYWSYVENDPVYGQNMTIERIARDVPAEARGVWGTKGWGYAIPQRSLYDAFEEGDPRRRYTVYAPGDDFGTYIESTPWTYTHKGYDENGETISWETTYNQGDQIKYDYRWSETGMNVRKMISYVGDLANVRWSGLDIPVMRMAELYLILAEALAEQGNQEALNWVNKVRSRATVNMPDKIAADGTLVDIVRHERRVELAMEGLRVLDLIRWGTLQETFGDGMKVKRNFFSDYLSESSSLKYDNPVGDLSKDPVFPIPQSEIDRNSNINVNSPAWQ